MAREVVENDVDAPGRFRAARDLLLGRPPRLGSRFVGELAREDETTRESATRLALELAESVLPVQGPPGTGKTYTGARVVCELVRAGQKVGITGPRHKVIRNLLDEVVKAAAEEHLELRILQRVPQATLIEGGPIQESVKSDCLAEALSTGEVDVAAGTVWAWAREDTEGLVDTLVIDEAGQLSLANGIAACTVPETWCFSAIPSSSSNPSRVAIRGAATPRLSSTCSASTTPFHSIEASFSALRGVSTRRSVPSPANSSTRTASTITRNAKDRL